MPSSSVPQAGESAGRADDGNQMQAVVLDNYGPPEVLHLTRRPIPEAASGEVLIRVATIGVNAIDAKCRRGEALPLEFPAVLGWDVAGTVQSLGPDVDESWSGAEVFGMLRFPEPAGAYAEYVTAPVGQLARRPVSIDVLTAGAIAMTGITAWQAIFDHAQLAAGQRVLVHGAAGGVGHLAVQLAKAAGAAEVIGTASAASHDFVLGLGADSMFDYTSGPLEQAAKDVDVVLDTRGGDDFARLVTVLKPDGIIVTLLGETPDTTKAVEQAGVRAGYVYVSPDPKALAGLTNLLVAGRLQVPVEHVLPLKQAADAHTIAEAGHVKGRMILAVE